MASFRKRAGRWQARVRRYGQPDVVKTFNTKSDAERWARQTESEIDKGTYINRSEAERTTLTEIIDRYIIEVSPSKRGGKEEIIRLKALKRHRIAYLSMAALVPQSIASYRDTRLETCSAGTVVRDLGMLSSVINHSKREWGISIENPVSHIRKPTVPQGRNRILSKDEQKRLLDALEPVGKRNPYMKPLVILALETAMRRGELLNLQWENVNMVRRTAHLPMTKNGESRDVPLSTKAIEILLQLPRHISGSVIPLKAAAMEANFSRARKRAEIEDLHFHDLRHTATTYLAEKVTNILELSAITGHKELRMLKRYYHPNAEEIAKKLR